MKIHEILFGLNKIAVLKQPAASKIAGAPVLLEQKTHPLSHRKFATCLPLVKQTLGGGLTAPM
jgi:hypothetical protein